MALLILILGIILFIGLVVVHEFGHFIVARRNGVEVEEFGIFFPPRLYKRRTGGGWDFTINAIPLGGFVRLKGEHDSDTAPGTFGAASLWVKTKIMAAGVVMNLVTALVLFTLLALIGMPKLIDNQFTVKSDTRVVTSKTLVGYIEPGSPAARAGLRSSDRLTAIAGRTSADQQTVDVTSATQLPQITKRFAGQPVTVLYIRNGQAQTSRLTLLSTKLVTASQNSNKPKGYLGIIPQQVTVRRSTWSAPVVAVGFSTQITVLTFQALGHALGGLGGLIAGAVTGNTTARQHGQTNASQLSGPVGIFEILKASSTLGYQFMLSIIALISLSLALMNILPIPALDGGRLWITLAARAIKRPLSARREEAINLTGFVVLFSLIILITIVDVGRFF